MYVDFRRGKDSVIIDKASDSSSKSLLFSWKAYIEKRNIKPIFVKDGRLILPVVSRNLKK
jgi:hypothetical protein